MTASNGAGDVTVGHEARRDVIQMMALPTFIQQFQHPVLELLAGVLSSAGQHFELLGREPVCDGDGGFGGFEAEAVIFRRSAPARCVQHGRQTPRLLSPARNETLHVGKLAFAQVHRMVEMGIESLHGSVARLNDVTCAWPVS